MSSFWRKRAKVGGGNEEPFVSVTGRRSTREWLISCRAGTRKRGNETLEAEVEADTASMA
jgi:hypothetical protein